MLLYPFINNLQYDEIPEKTKRLIGISLLDIIGIIAGASDNQTSINIKNYACQHYSANKLSSRLLFDDRKVHPLGAAWAGGFSADSLDAHEGHFTSKGHAGATVVPALLALTDACFAQGQSISGKEFLTALTIAYETSLRAGTALMGTASEYHASGAFSGLGIVCAGARLLKLTEAQFLAALGIAEYFGPRCPMMRLVDFPSMLRDAHGAGAYAGVNALLMARHGITGAPAATVEFDDVRHYWQGLGDRWEIDAQYFKPWPVCRWAQPALTAVTNLIADNKNVDASEIKKIVIETFHESTRLQGHTPENADEAQYGLAFPVAALICRGQLGPKEVTGESVKAIDILALSQRIEIVDAEDLSARFPKEILSRVIIDLNDGTQLSSATTQAKGDPQTPMTGSEHLAKFNLIAGVKLNDTRRTAITEAVSHLAKAENCQSLFDLIMES
jgi:2-methylcitrate dehydratase PrpD